MRNTRRMGLNAVIFGLGSHEAGWRMPESDAFASTAIDYWIDIARRAEKGGFDALFLGDVLALQQSADRHLSDAMDPLVILSALASVTSRIGLIGTASTSFDHPFHLARRFASLDHITKGRAGWNIVTSSNTLEANNFGLDDIPDHADRYARAADVTKAAIALWNSWESGARIADKQSGRYFDPAKVQPVNHHGHFVRSRGPLNVPRSPQGRPILAQAGASEAGRDFAARYADMVFTVQSDLVDAQAFYQDMKARALQHGRAPESLLIYPGIVPIAAPTQQQAEERLGQMNSFMVIEHVLAKLSEFLGTDLAQADLDAPLPNTIADDASQNQSSQSRVAVLVNIARRDHLTLRQLLMRLSSGRGHLLAVGTGADIAATMQLWFDNGAADGFNVMAPVMPDDLQSFVDLVVPALVDQELFAVDHQPTLRQRLRLR
ncbi:FMN-dependent oxidoreductase, nitrilotriacetate monooxygenase family [Devosia crocina]|uniref:FMN-dependent oxidoreductase, nitrilotriacetate monooxygenase family n=1 Tax=Devosia crocina TaxID=429728 RepID=A0A1I7MWP9_9HYPH|nr:LLM class flavin-dependent oxidoreductase [Devosia crocina]SFV26820.1 FMN-dependent oxidoreductase, nitrilotriacetate monooxygenase family [Devosia crocina]